MSRTIPDQFFYPYGYSALGRYQNNQRATYKQRRFPRGLRQALRRLNKPPEPDHPDQLRLF